MTWIPIQTWDVYKRQEESCKDIKVITINHSRREKDWEFKNESLLKEEKRDFNLKKSCFYFYGQEIWVYIKATGTWFAVKVHAFNLNLI